MTAPPEKKCKKEKPSTSKSTKSARSKIDTDNRIQELDQKWSERFNRLEALLLARSMEPILFPPMSKSLPLTLLQLVLYRAVNLSSDLPSWSLPLLSFLALAPLLYSISWQVKLRPVCCQVCRPHLPCFLVRASLLPSISRPVMPDLVYHLLPQCFLVQASLLHSIIRPVKLRLRNRPPLLNFLEQAPLLHSISRLVKFSHTDRPHQSFWVNTSLLPSSSLLVNLNHTDHTLTDVKHLAPTLFLLDVTSNQLTHFLRCDRHWSPILHRSRKDSFSCVSSEPESQASDQSSLDIYVEEGELSDNQDITVTDQEQHLSEEQTYRETMRGIHSFMGWSHILDMKSATNASDDNPFAGPKTSVPGKVSVQMPTEDWLSLVKIEPYSG